MIPKPVIAAVTLLVVLAVPSPASAQQPGLPRPRALHFERIQDAAKPAYIARNASIATVVDERGLTVLLPDGRELRCSVVGATSGELVPDHPTGGTSSYYLGSNAADGHVGIPHYSRVGIRGVRPGVDVVCYPAGPHLEFDLELAPAVDPADVRLRLGGVAGLRVLDSGALEVPVGEETLTLRPPTAYQTDATDGGRREIASRYRVVAQDDRGIEIAFELDEHDASRPLVIDPIVEFSTLLGGGLDDDATDVAYDPVTGDTVVVGGTNSADFPLVNALAQPYTGGHTFVSRFDSTGALVHSTFLGDGNGSGFVDVDRFGNAVIAGATLGTIPVTAQALQPTRVGGVDWFVTKLSVNGQILWSTYAGGSGDDTVAGVEVGLSDFVFVAGHSTGGFPATPGAYSGQTAGPVVAAIDSGLRYHFATGLAFTGRITALALDTFSGVWVTGTTTANDMPTAANAFQTANPGSTSAFVFGLTSDGASRVVSSYFGGSGFDAPQDLYVRFDSNLAFLYVTLTGDTGSTDLPAVNALQPAPGGGNQDGFVAQFTHNLGGLRFSSYLGGSQADSMTRIAEDADHRILVAGWTTSKDLPMDDAFQGPAYQGTSGYLIRLLPDGSAIDYATYFGGRFNGARTAITGLDVQPGGEAIVVGTTRNAVWYTTPNAIRPVWRGARNSTESFLLRFSGTTIQSYGQGTGDNFGIVPVLSAAGDLTPGSTVKLRIQDGSGGQNGVLALGFTGRTSVPLFGGTLLVSPVSVIGLTLGGGSNNQWGHWAMDLPIPMAGTLSGITVQAQAVLGTPAAATFTQGIELPLR